MSIVWFIIYTLAMSYLVLLWFTYVLENFEPNTKKLYYLCLFLGLFFTIALGGGDLLPVDIF